MNITHYPISNGIFSELDHFVNQALGRVPQTRCEEEPCSLAEDAASPGSDQDGWKLRLELPGYKKEEVKLSVDEQFLQIVAETDDEQRSFLSRVEKRIKISEEVDVEKIQARLDDGILFLQIPRRVKAEPVSIVVK